MLLGHTSAPAAEDPRSATKDPRFVPWQQQCCCQSQALGLIQTGKPRVPVKELNKGPVSDKKEIKLLDCWL